MKTLKELRELRASAHDRGRAILDSAQADARDLTAEETKAIDGIFGQGKSGDANYVKGELDLLDEQIARGERIEARQKELAAERAISQQTQSSSVTPVVASAIAKQRHGSLKGFQNKEDAFTAGCWAAAQLLGNQKAAEFCNSHGIQIYNAMSGTDNGAGGYLVPEVMENSIVRLVQDYGVFRRNARVFTMSTDTVQIPRNTGSVTAYFVGETPSSITASDMAFELAELRAKVMAVRTLLSLDLVEDAIIDLANYVAQDAALKFAEKEDDCGFNGTGASTYGGIVGLTGAIAAGSKKTAATGNTAFATLDNEDFLGMVGLLPSYARSMAKWYISQAGWADSMARLQSAAGGNTVMDMGNGPVLQYLGYPVVITEKMNATTTAQTSTDGLVFLGRLDLAATVGVRRGIRVQVLRELYAATRQIGLIIDQRLDINVHERGTASVAGPIVMLSTPGS